MLTTLKMSTPHREKTNGGGDDDKNISLTNNLIFFQSWLLLGNKQRATAATGLNEKSSRSHAVFSIVVTQIEVNFPFSVIFFSPIFLS